MSQVSKQAIGRVSIFIYIFEQVIQYNLIWDSLHLINHECGL